MRTADKLAGVVTERFVCNSGSNKQIKYEPRINDKGFCELVDVGIIDTDEMIQAELAGTDLKYLLARFLNGDPDALRGKPSFYADVTGAPKTLAEAMDVVLRAEYAFDQLPVDVKKEYGSDWRRWLASFDSKAEEKVIEVEKPSEIIEQKESAE